jgi:4-amino-4-deoxy-L-arabinose transferase-like glycosyltransferase
LNSEKVNVSLKKVRLDVSGRKMLFLVFMVAMVLRVAAIPFDSIEDLMDANHLHAWEQGNVARSLVAGHGFGSPFQSDQASAIMPPVYPLIVAMFFRVFGVHTAHSILAVHIFDCVVNSLACIPIFLLARRNFGERAGRWSAWAWAVFPYGIYFSAAWAWSTHLLLLGLCWLLYLSQTMEDSSRLTLWAGFGLLAGLTGLCEPSALAVVPFVLLLCAIKLARSGKRWLMPGMVASLTLAAAISPWIIRNAIVFHRFIPMRDSMGLELWMGNNGESVRFTSDELHPLHDMNELAAYNRMGELQYMDHKAQQARAYISTHRQWYAWMCARRVVYLWTGYWSFQHLYLAQEPTDPENIPFATGLTLIAIAGLALLWKQSRFSALRFAAVMFVFPMIYYFNHPEPYHMRALDPLMVMLGCFALITWRERVKEAGALPATTEVVAEA